MTRRGWFQKTIPLLGLAGLLTSGTAGAYLPPSGFILQQFARKKSGLVNIRIKSLVSAIENNQATSVRFRLMTQVDLPSRRVRIRAYDDQGRELYAVTRMLPADAVQASRGSPVLVSPLFGLLTDPRSEVVIAALKGAEIPIRTENELLALPSEEERRAAEAVQFDRLGDGVVAWRLGQDRGGSTRAQLWIEKDTFLPLRLIYETPEGPFEHRFEGYRYQRDMPFPAQVTVYPPDGSNRALLRETIQEFWINPEGNEMSRGFAGEGYTEQGNLSPGPIRDFVQTGLRILR
jgi:hypothetical protein